MEERQKRYWRNTMILVAALLSVWATVSFGLSIFLVESLNQVHVAGFPLGFWTAQQGAIFVFVGLIFVYCVVMDRLDRDLQGEE